MPHRGMWQITPAGERRLIQWCCVMHEFVASHSDWTQHLDDLEEFFQETIVITKNTVLAAETTFEIAQKNLPDAIVEVSPEIRGKIGL